MEPFRLALQIRWSDLDPNFHLRHSVYYDWGALCRIDFLAREGLTADVMSRLHCGPILFREECIFRKEVRYGDGVYIELKLTKARADFSRWSIEHTIFKNENTVAATLSVDGAWMDTSLRKLTAPPREVHAVFTAMPRTENFSFQ